MTSVLSSVTPLRGLYAITADGEDGERLLAQVQALLEGVPPGSLAALQYRNKHASPAQRRQEAGALARACRLHRVPFIVNDDLALALQVGADGLHLGRTDGSLAQARAAMPAGLLGASCHDSLESARAAVRAGASYVAFGSVFASTTKPAAVRAPLSLFAAARGLGVPLVAIGGITLDNAAQVLAAGADCLAVISDLFAAPDIAVRARAYAELFLSRPQTV